MEAVELKIPRKYLDFLNRATFSEGVNFVLGLTYKRFRVARDDLIHIPMEILVSKPLKNHLGSTKDLYM